MLRGVCAAMPRRARVSRGMGIAAATGMIAALAACGGPTAAGAPQAGTASPSGSGASSGSTGTTTSVTGSSTAATALPGGTPAPASATPAGSTASTPRPDGGSRPGGGLATPASTVAPAVGGWTLLTTYTAVESFHSGAPQDIQGCPPGANECPPGQVDLGSYPSDFVDAVRAEGSGRITSGSYAGKYLMYDADSGYAVDTAVRDDSERPMVAYASAGGDPGLNGTAFTVSDCGLDAATGRAPSASACSRIERAQWTVRVAARHTGQPHLLELYVGEEDGPGFAASSPLLLHTAGARTSLP